MTGELLIKADRPIVSEGTILLAAKWQALNEMRAQGAEESAAYLQWSLGQALDSLNGLNVGTWSGCCPFGSTFLYTRTDWDFGGHMLGIAYSAEGTVGTKLLPEYSHVVGVRMEAVAGQAVSQRGFREMVRQALFATWDGDAAEALHLHPAATRTIRPNQARWPIYKHVRVRDAGNWEAWTEHLCETLVGFARAFSPALSLVAEQIRSSSSDQDGAASASR